MGCALVSSFGKAWVQSGGCHHWFSLRHTFRKVNDTITKLNLDRNTIGDAGAIALGRKSEGDDCDVVLQVRMSLFLWQVCAHIHRRNSNCEAVTAISQFCQGTVATSADALSSGWVRSPWLGGALEVHTGAVLSRTESEQAKPAHPSH